MHALLLQDWITLSTSAAGPSITQGADSWLDVDAFEDLFFFLEVKLQSGASAVLLYQTAPVAEDASFANLLPGIPVAAGTRADKALATYLQVPVARFLRWQLSAGGASSATFRIWVAGHSLD